DGFLQRNLRDETEGSHVVRVNANLQRHEKRLPPFKACEKNPCCSGEGGAAIPSADRKAFPSASLGQLINRLGVDGRRLEEVLHLDMFGRLVGRLLLARKERTEGDAVFEGPGIGASPVVVKGLLFPRPL